MPGEEEDLEREQELLSHAGDIQLSLGNIIKSLSEEEINVLGLLGSSSQELMTISKYFPDIEDPQKRMESAYIELKDIGRELEKILERVDFALPGRGRTYFAPITRLSGCRGRCTLFVAEKAPGWVKRGTHKVEGRDF